MEIGAFLRDVLHFPAERIGAYTLLLFHGWVTGGRLLCTEEEFCTITRLSPERWAVHRDALARKYTIAPDGAWVHLGMQARMRIIGVPVQDGDSFADPALSEGAGAEAAVTERGATDRAGGDARSDLSAKRAAAARAGWARRNAKPDANGRGSDASGDAKPDANLHRNDANPDANLQGNLKEKDSHQPPRLDVARGSEPLGEGGGLVDELLRIFNNPSCTNIGALAECIREWRGLGLSDDAICIEVQAVSDANRGRDASWVPMHPSYYSKALQRRADAKSHANGDANPGVLIEADPWDQRVRTYAATGRWLDEWEGKPDSGAPNPDISNSILVKHGFRKGAA